MTSNPELTTVPPTYNAPPPPNPNAQQARLLRRSTDDKVLGGVCGGVARYLGVDAVLIRLLFVALTIMGFGAGVVAYLVAWIVIPKDRPAVAAPSAGQSTAVASAPLP